ncbi:TPA: cell division protein FtsA [Methanopyrus kandleri]|uniref:Predicted ATPase of the HSP70 class involved in cell division n=2 Tax=Methanopyrus kandleri TaxID=2320 RepID=Q8TY55_METKA|nr:Predicted ATPase of the HSP70 class involved in cell division [Methanopyrus kandleri AV19]HII70389.1 cell division protein FtsA [Methanopyrus kandleri]
MHVVAVDLGTEVISAAVGRLRSGNLMVKGYSERYILDPTIMERGNVRYVKGVSRIVKKTVEEALRDAGVSPSDVEGIGLSMTGDRFTMVEAEASVSPEGKLRIEDIGYTLAHRLEFSPENWPISVDIVDLKVDGAEVDPRELGADHPDGLIGSQVTHLQFRAIVSNTSLGLINNLERIARLLNMKLITISVEPLAVAKAIRDYKIENCLLIDSGGGTTDISVVRNTLVEVCHSIKVGGRDFTLAIANDLGLTYEEAENIKKKINSPMADSELSRYDLTRREVLEAIEEVAEYVRDAVRSAVKSIIRSLDMNVPERVELYGGGVLLDQAETAVREAILDAYRDYLGIVPRVEMLEASKIPHIGKQLAGPMRVVAVSVLRDTALCQQCSGRDVKVVIDEFRAPEGRYYLEVGGRIEDSVKIPRRTGLKEAIISAIKEIILMQPAPVTAELRGRAYAGTVTIKFEGVDSTDDVDGVKVNVSGSEVEDTVDTLPKEYKIVQVKEMGPILIPVDELQEVEGGVSETAGNVTGLKEGLDDSGGNEPR